MVGMRYWAKQALTSVLSHTQALNMKLLLQQPESSYGKPETGALMVVCLLAIHDHMQCFLWAKPVIMLYACIKHTLQLHRLQACHNSM